MLADFADVLYVLQAVVINKYWIFRGLPPADKGKGYRLKLCGNCHEAEQRTTD
jgi:hypothetical protein